MRVSGRVCTTELLHQINIFTLMKVISVVGSGLLLAGWVLLGSAAGPFGLPLPALGPFFNPASGYWANTRTERHDRADVRRLTVSDPRAAGTVFFDDRGVPHLFAEDLNAASFLQGYLHAADRLWQMDVSTRATEGRLSEVLGRRTYDRDVRQIQMGYRQSARQELELIRKDFAEDYAALDAYAAGINAYVATLDEDHYPVEYKLLGHEPLRWSPYRSLLLLKGMSQSLSSSYQDAETVASRERLGPELYAQLFPEHLPGESPVVPDAPPKQGRRSAALSNPAPISPNSAPAGPAGPPGRATRNKQTALASSDAESSDPYTLMPAHPGNGSNNWAVSAARSNTGYPMLANDPHLALTLPSIWYEIQIHLPDMNARGVSLPGAPGILMGYNDHIAYGETNVGHDVTDWFRITWHDKERTAYLLDGKATPVEWRRDTLRVKGEEPTVLEVPLTVFGPVPFTEGAYADHAYRYLGHETIGRDLRPHSSIGAFLRLMRAEGYEDYETALKGHVDPAQNFVYADRYNTVAIRPNGFFPIRAAGNGSVPLEGDTRANDWRGYIPFEQRPAQRNPERGFVSSANQITTGPDYPYPYSGSFDEYRGRYINRALGERDVMNQRSMKELQLDAYSLQAEEITPLLLARLNRTQLTDAGSNVFRLVADWDYRYAADSRAPTVFEAWLRKVYDLTFDELAGNDSTSYRRPDHRVWTDLARRTPDHPIFDIAGTPRFRETAATLVQRAFEETVEDLEGGEPERWAVARGSRVRHLGGIPGFGSELILADGGRSCPRVLIGGHGASWRMVVELGKHPRAWGSLPGGASGHPGSEAYDNGLEDWINGRYHDLTRWRDWEEAEVKSVGRWEFGGG